MIYDGHMTKSGGQDNQNRNSPHLLQITLYDGGRVSIDQERIAGALTMGIEYRSLKAIMVGLHDLMGSLIELATEAKLADSPELPTMKEPGRIQ